MAIRYSDTAAIRLGQNSSVLSLVNDGRKEDARLKVTRGITNIINAQANWVTANKLYLAWVPFGALIDHIKVSLSAVISNATDVDIGILGLSATPKDNNSVMFVDGANFANAQALVELPSTAAIATGGTFPYEVTDPAGAVIVLEPKTPANAQNTGNFVVRCEVFFTE
jgi:hypothetical protein